MSWCHCYGSQCMVVWQRYYDTNDAVQLARDPAMQAVVCRQPGAAPAICPGLQSGQLSAQAMLAIKDWSLRSLQVKLIKIGERIVRHARQIIFQLAEVAVSRDLFAAHSGADSQVKPVTRLSTPEGKQAVR